MEGQRKERPSLTQGVRGDQEAGPEWPVVLHRGAGWYGRWPQGSQVMLRFLSQEMGIMVALGTEMEKLERGVDFREDDGSVDLLALEVMQDM